MFHLNDFILLLVIFSSMITGILFPRFGSLFQPYPLYLMMTLLFLSFLSINIETIWRTIRGHGKTIVWLSFLKMIGLPLGVYFLFRAVYPPYAVAALLLTGVSTGVVAPFISTLVKANDSLVLVMVVISSALAPFTLPALVKLLLGRSIHISLFGMIRMLSLVIFIPLLAVEILRRLDPKAVGPILKRRFPCSLAIFAMINLGVFSKYAAFFHRRPGTILEATGVALALAGIYLVAGIAALWKSGTEDQLASAISFGNMNNVLIIVFASGFFGPLEPTLAVLYMIPFFGLILPFRIYHRLREKSDSNSL